MTSSGAVRRIQREFKELQENPSKSWVAQPAGDDLFEWLEALRSFFPSPGEGAIGSLDWPHDLRVKLAKESLEWESPILKQKLIEILPPLPEGEEEDAPDVPPEALDVVLAGQKGGPPAEGETNAANVPLPDDSLPPSPSPPVPSQPQAQPAAQSVPQPAAVQPVQQPQQQPAPVQHATWVPPAVPMQAPPPQQAAAAPVAPKAKAEKRPAPKRAAPKQVPILLQLVKMPRTALDWGVTIADLMAIFFFGAICVLFCDIVMSPPHSNLMIKK